MEDTDSKRAAIIEKILNENTFGMVLALYEKEKKEVFR